MRHSHGCLWWLFFPITLPVTICWWIIEAVGMLVFGVIGIVVAISLILAIGSIMFFPILIIAALVIWGICTD